MITPFYIQQVIYGLVGLLLGLAVIGLLSKLLKRSRLQRFWELWRVTLTMSFLATLTLVTNPLQNHFLIMLGGVVLRYVTKYFWKGLHRKKYLALIAIFYLGVLIVGGTATLSPGQTSQGFMFADRYHNILYDSDNNGTLDMRINATNKDGIYNQVTLDLNGDNKADLVQTDTNTDGEIDTIAYLRYTNHARRIIMLILAMSIVAFVWSRKDQTTVSVALLLLLILPLGAWAQDDFYDQYQALLVQYQDCVISPWDDAACTGVPDEGRLMFQHMQNPEFTAELQSYTQKFLLCQNSSSGCSDEQWEALWTEGENLRNKWLAIPAPEPTITAEELPPGEELSDEIDVQDLPAYPSSGTDDTDPLGCEVGKCAGSDDTSGNKIPQEGIVGPDSLPPSTKDVSKEIADTSKSITDISIAVLGGLNELEALDEYIHGTNVTQQNINQIKGQIEKRTNTNGLKVDDKIYELNQQLNHLQDTKGQTYTQRAHNNPVDAKWTKTMDALGHAGAGLDAFMDYKDFEKAFGGDTTKTTVATTATTIGKTVVSANPVDLVMGVATAGLKLLGQDQAASITEKFQAGDIVKQTVIDGYATDAESMGRVFADQAMTISDAWNQSNYNVVEKVGVTLNATVTIGYGLTATAVGGLMDVTEGGIDAFGEGVHAIANWF